MAETVHTKTPLPGPVCLPMPMSARAFSQFLVLAALLFGLAVPFAWADPGASAWFTTDQSQVRLIAAQPFVGDDAAIELGLEFASGAALEDLLALAGGCRLSAPSRLGRVDQSRRGRGRLAGAAALLGAGTRDRRLRGRPSSCPSTPAPRRKGRHWSAHLALDYLTCNDICIPNQAALTLHLPAAPEAAGGGFGPLIARFAARVPGDGHDSGLALVSAVATAGRAGRARHRRAQRPPARPARCLRRGCRRRHLRRAPAAAGQRAGRNRASPAGDGTERRQSRRWSAGG